MARSRGPHPFGRSGKVDFCVLRVFCVKVQGRGPASEREFSQAMEFRSFFSEFFGWGRTLADASQPNSFPNFYGDRPVPIGQMRSDDRSLLKIADSSVIFSMKLVDRELSEEKILRLQRCKRMQIL